MGAQLRRLGVWSALLLVFNVDADVEGDRYPLAKRTMPDLAGAVESLLAGHEVMLGDTSSKANCQAFGQAALGASNRGRPYRRPCVVLGEACCAATLNAVI